MISKSEVIKRGYKYLTRKQLATILGFSCYQLNCEIDRLCITKNKAWSSSEEGRLIDLYENSKEKIPAIASIMRRSEESVKGKLKELRRKGEVIRRNSLTSASN